MAISAQAVNSIHRATVMPSWPFFMARPSAIGSVICGRSAPETLRASGEATSSVRVFGGWRRSAGGPGQPACQATLHEPDRAARAQTMAKIDGRLGPRQERASSGGGSDDDLGHQATTADTLDGIVRLEDEGARHRGQRQIQRNVHQDRHEESPAAAHAEILPDGGVTD